MRPLRLCVFAFAALSCSAGALAHDEPKPRLLAVSGEGEVTVAPDRADVGFSVEASEKTLADAERIVSEGVGRLLKLCESLDIAKNQIRSAQLNVQPQYDGSMISNRPRIVGYGVSRQVNVDLKDLGKLGRLLQGAVEGGANRISGHSLSASESGGEPRPEFFAARMKMAANSPAPEQSYEAGEIKFSASVSVEYDLP